ncbi:hypothetical protein [Halobacillus sp. KGW1]|uniref:hypothetical protein n=1 Tax=Halobacillus sp. KGW1 TaxID=1793726 RepID=UPI000784940C|nr:hypothetical protein [Halobacillus sp. KGW1]
MNGIGWLIVFSEIGFWVVILLGLVLRYVAGKEKAGLFFLALTPVIDLLLLIATSVDLYRGATATTIHAVAAVYIGVSIAFGKSMIRWADERFQYYVTKSGPKPKKRKGMEHARHYFKSFLQHILAYAIGSAFLWVLIWLIGDPERTEALFGVWRIWSLVLGADFLIALSHFLWPKK